MHLLYLQVLFVLAVVPHLTEASSLRHRRDVTQLGELIECQTGRSAMDYISYGCWCGIGGSEEPLDETDRCCRNHDLCYDELYYSGVCEGMTMYTVQYSFLSIGPCPRGGPLNCSVDNNPCAMGLCRCDETVVNCFRDSPFQEKYKKYSRFIGCSTRKYLCSWFGC
ncbi:Phospholipase A2, membrane associated [Holothuria leucospilota]|uniref:Phospholipase A2 n=1 Tax=Holothuria leucospilota TaxID=206669 RepID=A0A9Q1C917_HOLLE|nr:Phospholipase A2, membrane associated [Holothuria leucospilota]